MSQWATMTTLVGLSMDAAWQTNLQAKPRVVYGKEPFGEADKGLEYRARYTHRLAILNERILPIQDDRVVVRCKDYRTGGEQKITSLAGVEFVRRFLQHVLPGGFQRIRYYGLLTNRHHQENLDRRCLLLGVATADSEPGDAADEGNDATKPEGREPGRCPVYGEGQMILRLRIPPRAG